MKRNHKIIAGLLVAGAFSGVAMAQGGRGCDAMGSIGPMGMGPMGGQSGPMGRQAGMKFDPAARAERHLEMLKGELKLTPEQQPLWQAFAEKMKSEAGKGLQAMRAQAADDKLTAPERMAKMQAMMQERLTAMSGMHESFNRLYEGLTPEQRAVADQHAARMGKGPMGGKPGGRSGGPGRGVAPQS